MLEQIERAETSNVLHSALSRLTLRQQYIVIMHAVYGLSFREIADKLKIHKETVREHLFIRNNKITKIFRKIPCQITGFKALT